MPDTPTIGELIAAGRKRLGLTQRSLADKISVHGLAVSRWETGRANPSHEHRIAVAEVLGLDPRELGVMLQRPDTLTEAPAWAAAQHAALLDLLTDISAKIDDLRVSCCEPPDANGDSLRRVQ